jgi:hypothetical protein
MLTALLAVTAGAPAYAQTYTPACAQPFSEPRYSDPSWYEEQGLKCAYQVPDAYANLTPVLPHELDGFVGEQLKGKAWAPLGIVAATSEESGTIAIVGRHGEVATIDHAMLGRYGMQLKAPTLTYGDIVRASGSGRNHIPLRRGEIIIGLNTR